MDYEPYTDLRALSDFRNRWDKRARQAEIYLSFRLEGKPPEEANTLAASWYAEENSRDAG